jgi:hypothetical protein
MTEFKPKPKYPKGVEGLRDALKQAKEDGVFTIDDAVSILPKLSNWTCYMFGGDAGFSPITWTPQEGKVPNAWVRFWMKVFFNCKWVKNDD